MVYNSTYKKLKDFMMKEAEKTTIITELKNTLITTRNFCGNLKQSAEDVFADNGMPFNEEIYAEAMVIATREWNLVRKEASLANMKAKA